MNRRQMLASTAAALTSLLPAVPVRAAVPVDLLLVMAVDVSGSITPEEALLQRQGYRAAMTDPEVLAAITSGPRGAIAVAYIEWAAVDRQSLTIPWTRIAGSTDGGAWADRLDKSPQQSIRWTSLSGALTFSSQVLDESPFASSRRVIDVSGDGPNNSGPPPEPVRDRLVGQNVTINGLPIRNPRYTFGLAEGQTIEGYYRDSVIGGDGAFFILASDFSAFGQAIRRKLIQEIAWQAAPDAPRRA